jgi:hypothetical protein
MAMQNKQKKSSRFQPPRKRRKRNADKTWANFCIFYLLLTLAFLSWELFDTWISRHFLLKQVGYGLQNPQTLRLIAFTIIAGALGGVVNGLRSTLHYHNRFDRRHAWKYLCAPWMGATLALFVYALLRSSVSVLGGGGAAGSVSNAQVLSNFSIGALVGYGSKDVFVWLDDKVTKIFHVAVAEKTEPRKSRSLARKRERDAAASHNGNVRPRAHHASIPVAMSTSGRAN